jgi:hypothetical protein
MALAAISLAGLAGVVRADAILQFGPVPNDNTPEFQFNIKTPGDSAPSFYAATGAQSNGDGNLPTASQTPGGLQLTTAFLPAYAAGRGQDSLDAHLFYDASLTLTGFMADAPAVDAVVSLVQSLGAGDFEIRATNGDLLLSGHANSATITGLDTTGSTFSADVVYTGGSFLSYLPGTTGGFSFTDLQITPTLSLGQTYISDFTANGTGDFRVDASFVPVPAAAWSGMGLIGLLGGMQFLRRRAIAG